jgi:hypothetical protein
MLKELITQVLWILIINQMKLRKLTLLINMIQTNQGYSLT